MPDLFLTSSCRGAKKHECPDCLFCQGCSPVRCNSCRQVEAPKARLSMAEQIARFERLNRDDRVRPDQPLKLFK